MVSVRKNYHFKKRCPKKIPGYSPGPSFRITHCFWFDIKEQLCSFVTLYRSPSQSQDDLTTFLDNFEMTLDLVSKKNPFLFVVLGEFNAKLSQWHDKDSSTSKEISVESITSQVGLHQIINEPTHILENSSLCMDLIFTSQPNLAVKSGTLPSPHPNCHHQIIYAKFNLEVFYPPPYTYEVWHYTYVDFIRESINEFVWDRAFVNKHVDEKVYVMSRTRFKVNPHFIVAWKSRNSLLEVGAKSEV